MPNDNLPAIDTVRRVLRDTGYSLCALEMGPFDQPVTSDQRSAVDLFCGTARQKGLSAVRIENDRALRARVIITNGRA